MEKDNNYHELSCFFLEILWLTVLSWFISQILWTAIIPRIFHSCHLFLHLPHPHLYPLPLLLQIQLRSTIGTKLTAGSFRGKHWAQIFLTRIQFGKRWVKEYFFFLTYFVRSFDDVICKRLISCFINYLKCFQIGKNLPLEGIFDCEDIRREFSIMPSQGRQNCLLLLNISKKTFWYFVPRAKKLTATNWKIHRWS